jgi:hypothetical protein
VQRIALHRWKQADAAQSKPLEGILRTRRSIWSRGGPTPQISPLAVGALGEKKKLWVVEPSPNCDPKFGATSFW